MAKTKTTKTKSEEEEVETKVEEKKSPYPEGFDPSLPESKQRWLRT